MGLRELVREYGELNFWKFKVVDGGFKLIGYPRTSDRGREEFDFVFTLKDMPKDLRVWLLIGLSAPLYKALKPLPNWEKYAESYITIDVQKENENLISIYTPTKLIAKIKGI